MKKYTLAIAIVLSLVGFSKADPLCTSWGAGFNLCLPLSSMDAAYGFNMATKEGEQANQALLETTVANIKDRLFLTFGGAKTQSEQMAPYASLNYGFRNPISGVDNFFSTVKPGVYGGVKEVFDNSSREYFWGFKASANIF